MANSLYIKLKVVDYSPLYFNILAKSADEDCLDINTHITVLDGRFNCSYLGRFTVPEIEPFEDGDYEALLRYVPNTSLTLYISKAGLDSIPSVDTTIPHGTVVVSPSVFLGRYVMNPRYV